MKFIHTDIYSSDAEDQAEKFVLFEKHTGGGCNTMILDSAAEAKKAKAEFDAEESLVYSYEIKPMPAAVEWLFSE